jgi:V8-like Glu-specific endopeptidase
MKRQEATERKVQQLARATSRFETEARAADEAFRRAMAATPSTQSEAKRRLDELEAQLQRPDADPSLAAERDRFRALLEGLPGREAALQRAYEKAVASLLFLYVEWDYEVAGVRRTRSGMGTGFVVDRRGWVVTAKHVVHPWKYQKFHLDLRREGIREWRRVGEPRIFAFRAADRFELRDDALHSPARWSSEAGTLSVLRLEDDLRMTEVGEIEPGYSNDVAILGLRGDLPPPLELAPPEEIAPDRLRPLTPILIAGFPLGSTAFERQEIVPQPTLGHIRKVEIFISHSVPTCSGNSGGPVLAENGRVIGLVNATLAGQNINLSLSAARIRELLPRD